MIKNTHNSFQSVEDLQRYLDSIYANESIDGSEYMNFFDSSLEEILLPKNLFLYLKENLSPNRYLGYSDPYGLKDLRASIACHYFDNTKLYEKVTITSGAQQALYLLTKVLAAKKSSLRIGLEEFSYIGYKHVVKNFNSEIVSLKMDRNGLKISELKKTCQKKKLDVLYLIPFLQNPTGINYSKKRIQSIFKLQKEFGFKIIMDASYYDLVNDDENAPSLSDLIRDDVYIVGTFSKILAADLRLGWVFSKDLAPKISLLRRSLDLFQPVFIQRAVSNFLIYDAKPYLKNLKAFWNSKRNLISSLFDLFELSDIFQVTSYHGGFYLWLKLRGRNRVEVDQYLEKKLLIAPGTFFGEEKGSSYLRLCYARVGVISFAKSFFKITQIYKKPINFKLISKKTPGLIFSLIVMFFKYVKAKIKMRYI
jgi:DNA-binding transcriptional MocR family regulator